MPGNPDSYVNKTYDQSLGKQSAGKDSAGKCPVVRGDTSTSAGKGTPAGNDDYQGWWSHQLDVRALSRHCQCADPWHDDLEYAERFATLDLDQVARDIDEILITPQPWWPADFGHYGPLILRMAWHSAGTYRMSDGRGGPMAGMQRFAPLNSWPDNRNLDKARRLLWPVKQKYGGALSWADLMVFAGNRALESMGCPTLGFAGGRADVWVADETYWGPESAWFTDERHTGVRDLDPELAASEMGLIYVDPQGPATLPDPLVAARDIRQTFARMGFDDEETVALIAGGHTFGKTHGSAGSAENLGAEPEAAPLEAQGLGWADGRAPGTATGPTTRGPTTSGLEGIWTATPTTWDNSFLETLFGYDWDVELSPAGLWQWIPSDGQGKGTVPDPFDALRGHHPTMLTTDLALRADPHYEPIARRFLENPEQFTDAFARAWFKLTHIDMGPANRYLGPLVPPEPQIWQDPVPPVDHELIDSDGIDTLRRALEASDLSIAELVTTAWASASTFRNSDKRGGANGARIRLEPQSAWAVNEPAKLNRVMDTLTGIKLRFNAAQHHRPELNQAASDQHGANRGRANRDRANRDRANRDRANRDRANRDMSEPSRIRRVSLADLIVLGGCVAIERAAALAGFDIAVPFRPGRTDATARWTDPAWFAALEPTSDGFRNYHGADQRLTPELALLDRANQLLLSAPEMTVLVGGLRVLGVIHADTAVGVLTDRPGRLTTDFFVNLLDMATVWSPDPDHEDRYLGRERATGTLRWTASRVDLIFAAHPELRALTELYAGRDATEKFLRDFVAAWHKVMELDLFDPPRDPPAPAPQARP